MCVVLHWPIYLVMTLEVQCRLLELVFSVSFLEHLVQRLGYWILASSSLLSYCAFITSVKELYGAFVCLSVCLSVDLLATLRKTRNSSGDEIANVNFLYDNIVHVLQNTIDSCISSATDRGGYVLEHMCLPNSVKLRNITAITSFKVIQGRRFWYQSNDHIRLPISD